MLPIAPFPGFTFAYGNHIDSKMNYLTKIKYQVRARHGRPKDDVGISVNLQSWLESGVPMIVDDIREFGTRHHV
jgi:hypothetical protein